MRDLALSTVPHQGRYLSELLFQAQCQGTGYHLTLHWLPAQAIGEVLGALKIVAMQAKSLVNEETEMTPGKTE